MLNQAEIDALLDGTVNIEKAATDERVDLTELIKKEGMNFQAEEEERQIRPYNFWSPDRFTKDQMRALELIHEELAERMTASLPSFLFTNMRPRLIHSEQGRFHDFLKDIPANNLFHLITLSPLPGQIVLTISPEISSMILERRLGGTSSMGAGITRSLTEIDQSLLRGMVEHILHDLQAVWEKVFNVEPGLEDSTINSHWVQMIMGNERVMLISFEMTLQGVVGNMNLYIPYQMLKPVASRLTPHAWISGRTDNNNDPDERNAAYQCLEDVSLPVRILLGRTKLPMSDLASLEEGDVIRLDTLAGEPMSVLVGNRVSFKARVGKIGRRLAAEITEKVIQDSPVTQPNHLR